MIWIILFSIPLGIAYLCWMAVTAWRRWWRKLLIQITAGVAYGGAVWAADVVHNRILVNRYFEGLFATSIRLSPPLFRFESARAFNGDGYTFEVYPLPPEIRQRFRKFDSQSIADFPQRPEYRSHWKTSAWHRGPATEADWKYAEFAFASSGSPELRRYQDEAKRILATSDAYLAYFYFDHGEHPGNVDLFLIDLAGDRLFLINLNT